MKNIFALAIIWLVLIGIDSCKKIPYEFKDNPTCYDGRQNQNETSIDCGGPCTACADAALAHSKKYYVSFMYDSIPVVFESDSDFVSYDPTHSYYIRGYVTDASGLSGNYVQLTIEMNGRSSDDVIALDNKTIYFENFASTQYQAHFELNGVGAPYESTSQVLGLGTSQTNRLIVDDVAIDNGQTPFATTRLLLTGRFNAVVSNSSVGGRHYITKGTFGIAFSANN